MNFKNRVPLVSIIIPAYNSEDTISKCIESICAQTYKNIDILIVDDGSADNTIGLCGLFLEKDSRIRIIMQENQGPFNARKKGIFAAKGDFVTFVDSDDWLENDHIESLVYAMNQYDMVAAGFSRCDDRETVCVRNSLDEGVYDVTTERFWKEYLINPKVFEGAPIAGIHNALWCKLFIREKCIDAVNLIPDVDAKMNEDYLFLFSYLMKSKRIIVVDKFSYVYVENKESVTQRMYMNYLRDYSDVLYKMIELSKDNEYADIIRSNLVKRMIYESALLADKYMGCGKTLDRYEYYLPFDNEFIKKRIILYGAGKVGKSYCDYVMNNSITISIVALVDSNIDGQSSYRGIPVYNASVINSLTYDIILISVKSSNLANQIKENLMSLGIDKSRIVWYFPKIHDKLAEVLLR